MNPWFILATGCCMALKCFTRNDADTSKEAGRFETLACIASYFGPMMIGGIAMDQSFSGGLGIMIVWLAWIYEAFERKRGFVRPPDQP